MSVMIAVKDTTRAAVKTKIQDWVGVFANTAGINLESDKGKMIGSL